MRKDVPQSTLLLIPQRYEFSSKSQQDSIYLRQPDGCCWYHKGTNFQANHNLKVRKSYLLLLLLIPQRYEFSSKSQPQLENDFNSVRCCWYHKGTNFQANHNMVSYVCAWRRVVADTTKVRIFKQITTRHLSFWCKGWLLLIPQRYEFSSKSQPASLLIFSWMLLLIPQRYEFSSKSQLIQRHLIIKYSCCWYHKGTNFQANHNNKGTADNEESVVADTTKVRIFKQITTPGENGLDEVTLLLIPQRYEFSSKSQLLPSSLPVAMSCCWYHKGTNFQANHNTAIPIYLTLRLLLIPQRYEFSSKSQLKVTTLFYTCVVADTTKVRIFKQITTISIKFIFYISCCWYHKGTNFQANHNKSLLKSFTHDVVADTTKVRIFKQITTVCQWLLICTRCCWYHKGTNFQANHNVRVSY